MGAFVGWTGHTYTPANPLYDRHVELAFSGEEFSDPTRDPDSTDLLRDYLQNPQTFPATLNGWFQGLLIDKARETVLLFNDRYGMHRLYYHQTRDTFYFAAEAKAILAVCPGLRTFDSRSLGEFVSCGCVLENRTLFSGIHVLPPGSAWEFQSGSLQSKASYFEPQEWEQQEILEPEAYYRELRDVFSRNLPRYFHGRQPIGMSLTGGLDTRMVMAWHRPAQGSLPCYTFAGPYREPQDVKVARRVAEACGQPHQVIYLGDEFLERFGQYAERTVYLTDGCVAVDHSPDLYVNERARDIAPVRMTGNYGGEVLRRVRAFKPIAPPAGLFTSELDSAIAQANHTYNAVADVHPLTFAVFRQAPWHHHGLLSLERSQLTLRSPFLDNDFVRTVYRAPLSTLGNKGISLRLIEEGNPALRRIPTDRGDPDGGWTARWQCAFQNLTFKTEYAYNYGMPQWFAPVDRLLRPLHPEKLFLGRHKFYHFRVWYRDQLAHYIREVLLDPRSLSRPWLQRSTAESAVTRHLRGDRNYTTELHKLLTLELIQRLLVEADISARGKNAERVSASC
jgi:asparagine synthase (glutamine-hydrolysing)